MTYLLGGGVVVFGLWALIATARLVGLKGSNVRLNIDNATLTGSLAEQVKESLDYRRRAQERIAHLLDEVESLEDEKHAEIAKIEDPTKRRLRRRAFVAGVLNDVLLLPEGEAGEGSPHETLVPGPGAPEGSDGPEDS